MRRFQLSSVIATALCAGILATLDACSSDDGEDLREPDQSAVTGRALQIAVDPNSDVSGFEFTIERVSCDGKPVTPFRQGVIEHLIDLALGPGLFAAGSAHLFVNTFIVLEVGCYDVTSQPIKHDGTNSTDCSVGVAKKVIVANGLVTEIDLVSQCGGNVEKRWIDAAAGTPAALAPAGPGTGPGNTPAIAANILEKPGRTEMSLGAQWEDPAHAAEALLGAVRFLAEPSRLGDLLVLRTRASR